MLPQSRMYGTCGFCHARHHLRFTHPLSSRSNSKIHSDQTNIKAPKPYQKARQMRRFALSADEEQFIFDFMIGNMALDRQEHLPDSCEDRNTPLVLYELHKGIFG